VTTYALLHGAWGSASNWYPLAGELERRGHRAVAVDLPLGEPSAGAHRYAEAVVGALGDVEDDLVVVGHSMGGLTAPVVATLRPVRRVVFVCALLPLPGSSFYDQVAAAGRGQIFRPGFSKGQQDHGDGSSSWVDLELAAARFSPDAPPGTPLGLRRQYWGVMREVTPLTGWPDVDYTYVVCTDDAVVNPDWSRRTFCERVNGELVELPGGHMPQLSRPLALAALLTDPS